MLKYIVINDKDYEYVTYANYDKVHEALYNYLCENFDVTDFIYDDSIIRVDNESILYCCEGAEVLIVNGTEYDPELEIDTVIAREFNGSAEAFIKWLTENDYLVLDNDFNEEFKDFMWNVVYAIANNDLPTVVVDFDDLFVSVHRDYDIDTAIDCVKELLD